MTSNQQEPTVLVHFWLPRDQAQYEGLAYDEFSSDGVAFVTKRELSMRQLLRISLVIKMPGEKDGKATPVVPAEITQVDVLKKGWRAYARFLDEEEQPELSGEDRRVQTRYPVRLTGEYMTVVGMPPHKCQVEDVSKGGVAIITDQGLKLGKHISLRVFSPQKDKLMIDAEVEVKRSQHKGRGVYEVGLQFLHNYAHPVGNGSKISDDKASEDEASGDESQDTEEVEPAS